MNMGSLSLRGNCIVHNNSNSPAEHIWDLKYTWWNQINPPSDAKLFHTDKQINKLLLFPVPSGTLDVYSMEEEAHTAVLW